VAFLEENQDQLPYLYPDLFQKCCHLVDQIWHYPYFKELQAEESPPTSPFRRRVWELLRRGEELLADMKKQHCWIKSEAHRGTPFPVLGPGSQSPAAPKTA
jgi:hypothetical protein